jgi:hypothetical protein
LDGGGEWKSQNIFDNKYNSRILEQANELEQGDKVNVQNEKNEQGYWQVIGIGGSRSIKAVSKKARKLGTYRGYWEEFDMEWQDW